MGSRRVLAPAMLVAVLAGTAGAGILNPSDIYEDGRVDWLDLAILAGSWLRTAPPELGGDIYEDGRVDWQDLAIVSENWLRTGDPGIPGDVYVDGRVDGLDFALLARDWLRTAQPEFAGDIYQDGRVDWADLAILSENWLRSGEPGIAGDVYVDGRVDWLDFAVLASNWLGTAQPEFVGDICQDGHIDWVDLAILSENWLRTGDPGIPGDVYVDGRVDWLDFAVLARDWLRTAQPDFAGDIHEDGRIDWLDFAILAHNWQWTEMARIPAGGFVMGDRLSEGGSNELPVHTVYVDSFYMSRYETTNRQYCYFLNSASSCGLLKVVNGVVYSLADGINSYPYCDTRISSPYSQIDYLDDVFSVMTKAGRDMSNDPVVQVSWYGAAAYCNWRSRREGYPACYSLSTWECDFTKHGYRLPTEAEWEYAALGRRYCHSCRFPWGDTISHSQANYYSSSLYPYDVSPTKGSHPAYNDGAYPYTAPAGGFQANGYGLYDMTGNVFEWCNDWYVATYYEECVPTVANPTGPDSGAGRVLRGGSFGSKADSCRVACRRSFSPGYRRHGYGFRVVLDVE
ncbi:MAG: SUMF1/EgtB/PvdO family nonheme iron enzyme [Planctomycetota bacterium]